jgi:gliding motility-associated lipoprotein GldH
MKKLWPVFCLVVLLFACGKTPLFKQTYDFSDQKWGGGESPKFTFRATDTKTPHNFVLTIRTTNDYEYNNIWVFMYTQNPNNTLRKDTLNLPLAESNGKWKGKNTGSIIENEFLIGFNKTFPEKGEYTVRFEQANMETELDNVLDITFEVSDTR